MKVEPGTEPFHLRSYIMSDTLSDVLAGVRSSASVSAVVTPDDPYESPLTWSADRPTYLRLKNASAITARHFRFRLLDGDSQPMVLDGPTYFTLLVRGAAGFAQSLGH